MTVNTISKATLLGMAACVWLTAAPMQPVQVVTTQREALTAGGVFRLNGSSGQVNVESWARPEIEIELTRSKYCDDVEKQREAVKQELDRIHLVIKRGDNGAVDVSTVFPSRRFLSPLRGRTEVGLNYRIHVPRDAKLTVRNDIGDVIVHDMTGPLEISTRIGSILLQLDGSQPYSIDAKAKFGDVYTEFSGAERQRHLIGQGFVESAPAPAPRIYLRVGIGGIKIQKIAAIVY